MKSISLFTILLFTFNSKAFAITASKAFDNRFHSIKNVDSTIIVNNRYFTPYNFIGEVIDGYKANECFLLKEAASALKQVQIELNKKKLTLLVYDCYRPQKAVDHFVRWAKDPTDTKMKNAFYPTLKKNLLIKYGYIAKHSSHSNGSAIDLTIAPLGARILPPPLTSHSCASNQRFKDNSSDMGSGYDCFHAISHTMSKAVGKLAHANRMLLKTTMENHGFKNYSKEWWHFAYKKVNKPKKFFDIDVINAGDQSFNVK